MVRNHGFNSPISLGVIAAFTAPQLPSAAPTFYGITQHVSVNNIKVTYPQTHQSLRFILLPTFDQVFSDDGKTTHQIKNVRPAQSVRVIYDQKALGMRNADRIIVLTKQNRGIIKQ